MNDAPLTAPPTLDAAPDAASVEARLTALPATLSAHHQAFADAVDAALLTPFRTALAEAARTHHALLAGLGQEEVPLAARLTAYQESVGETVLAPLCDVLDALPLRDAVEAQWQALVDAQAVRAAEAPAVLTRPEPETLYTPAPGDTLGQRLGKAAERGRRGRRDLGRRTANTLRRLVRKDPHPAPAFTQTVPYQQLLRYHLGVRMPALQRALPAQAYRQVAQGLARLEHGVTAWTHALLAATRAADVPAHYLPDGAAKAPKAPLPEEVSAQAEALDALLHALATLPALSLAALEEAAETAHQAFAQDVHRAGSFLLDLADRAVPAEGAADVREATAAGPAWARWQHEAVNRLRLAHHLLAFRAATTDVMQHEVDEVLAAGRTPVLERLDVTVAGLRRLGEEAAARCAEAHEAVAPEALHDALEALLHEAEALVDTQLLQPLAEAAPDAAALAAADEAAERLLQVRRSLPPPFTLHALPDVDTPTPQADPREVSLRELAEQALDALLVERLRGAARPVAEAAAQVVEEAGQLPTILRFNLQSALQELRPDDAPGDDAGDAPAGHAREAVEAAQAFAVAAFERSAATADGLRRAFAETPEAVAQTVFDAHARAWERLHERVRQEGRVQEQLLDLRARLTVEARRLAQQTGLRLRQGRDATSRFVQKNRKRLEQLVQMGQSAVGAPTATEADTHTTLASVAGVEALLARFPLVYHRLFSFQPITDPALLGNREADVAAVLAHLDRWQRGLAGALVVTADYGNGLTSFLNVLRTSVLTGAEVTALRLEERIEDERVLVAHLAQALGLAESAPATLDALAERLLRHPPADRPRVCILEHLEHLVLRAIGGTELLSRLLTFFSRTDAQVLWIGTMTEQGWHFVQRTAAVPTRLVTLQRLAPMGREALQTLLLNRHQRSGLPLVFEAPRSLNPLQRRRLRRARNERERQQVLQQDFFEGLYRASGPNILLALFYWLQSARLDEEAATLTMQPVQPLNFAFLTAFPLPYAFSLKAFLQHGSLTLDEHTRIFQTTEQESFQVFEALYNHLLLVPFGRRTAGGAFDKQAIQAGQRYRIRPMVVHPVLQYLRARHIEF